MKNRGFKIKITYLLLVFLAILPRVAFSKTVILPLTVEYPLLRSLVIQTSFTDADQTAVVMEDEDGCTIVKLSEPAFSEKNGFLQIELKVYVEAGIGYGDHCLMPIQWDGFVSFLQEPKIDSEAMRLSFKTIDSAIFDRFHKPQKVTEIIWKLIKKWAYEYLDEMTVDLAPPVDGLKSILELSFPDRLRDTAKKMVDSLRLGDVQITPDAVKIDVLAEVEEVYTLEKDRQMEFISAEELEQIIEIWETWDAFLVNMVLALSTEPLSQDDREVIFETLLDTRYRFTAELTDGTVSKDVVREQFVEAWTSLSPVFRNHLGHEPSEFTLGYLAFFTASDALAALDEIGPSLGIEISRNGLLRLSRLLPREKPVLLEYGSDLNLDLRQLLDLGPPLSASRFEMEMDTGESWDEEHQSKNRHENFIFRLAMLFPATVWAAGFDMNKLPPEVDDWIPRRDAIDLYMKRIKVLFENVAEVTLKKRSVPARYHKLFKDMVLSTAWQESCFQQYKIRGGKVTYLLSYNKTSIGVMQINQRVWRGIYDLKQLKWNLRYNALAGAEIVDQYFRRYALRKLSKDAFGKGLTQETLAGIVYAMYNGGPRQFKRFIKVKKEGKAWKSDRLYLEKLRWVQHRQWKYIKKCIRGI